jgi:hypothetical protein
MSEKDVLFSCVEYMNENAAAAAGGRFLGYGGSKVVEIESETENEVNIYRERASTWQYSIHSQIVCVSF